MPIGTGAIQSTNLPGEPFVVDPDAFFSMTTKNTATVETAAAASGTIQGMSWSYQLPQTGIISLIRIVFDGTVTVTAGGATAGSRWPYGLLDSVSLSVNGQNNLWSCSGEDLDALRFARFPAYEEHTDTYPGTKGGGSLSAATSDLHLTWEIPVAADMTTLVGSIYAQSGATNINLSRRVATAVQLCSANDSRVSYSGTFYTQVVRFSVPRAPQEGSPLVIPDLTRTHSFNAIEVPISNTGEDRLPLIRSDGSLARLFVSGNSAANTPLSMLPSAAAANSIDALRLEYGNAQRPVDYTPASLLASENNDYYGNVLPYNRYAIDFVRENAPRDMLILKGVTDLVAVPTINAAVSLSGATGRLVQEVIA